MTYTAGGSTYQSAGGGVPGVPIDVWDAAGHDWGNLEWDGTQWVLKATSPTQNTTTPQTYPGATDTSTGTQNTQALSTENTDTQNTDTPPVSADLNLTNATLVKVKGGGGTYYVEYPVYGTVFRYLIGDAQDLANLGEQDWPQTVTVSSKEFKHREGMDLGLIDERVGVKEDPQATVDRQLRTFGLEDLPAWQKGSKHVMTILLTAANEGWSVGRTFTEVSGTKAFKKQFPFFSEVQSLRGDVSGLDAFKWYTAARDQIRTSIRAWRGTDTTADGEMIGALMAQGWDPAEVDRVLEGEARLREIPGAVDQINQLLVFQGKKPSITQANMLDFILGDTKGETPKDVLETINDALRAAAFAGQGIDLSPALASALGPGESYQVLNPDQLNQIASETATNIFRFGLELQAEREGLTRDELITAMVNGTNAAGVSEKLAKFARRRQIESGGVAAGTAYQDQAGQVRLLGLQGL